MNLEAYANWKLVLNQSAKGMLDLQRNQVVTYFLRTIWKLNI